ncbi:hypothetical protein WR25_13790 isoform B [Diploscapter pachys]|uniref:Globin family profile domain-containing protein n=1 Tax=Diploscapter pachys TaxID=2018661 RepID=A0A2A2JHV2_9BILA|nr:hypothetical protein WR25_13790 isoform B [Diploscapter pachys]
MSISNGQGNCGATIIRRLLARSERIKHVFETNHLIPEAKRNESFGLEMIRRHQSHVLQFLDYSTFFNKEKLVTYKILVISNLDNPEKISELCYAIGLQHRKYKAIGLKTDYWDMLGEAITETIREYQGWKRHRESLRAANLLASFIIDRVRAGFIHRDFLSSATSSAVSTPIRSVTPSKAFSAVRKKSSNSQSLLTGSSSFEYSSDKDSPTLDMVAMNNEKFGSTTKMAVRKESNGMEKLEEAEEGEDRNGNSRTKTNESPRNSGSSIQGEEKAAAKPESPRKSVIPRPRRVLPRLPTCDGNLWARVPLLITPAQNSDKNGNISTNTIANYELMNTSMSASLISTGSNQVSGCFGQKTNNMKSKNAHLRSMQYRNAAFSNSLDVPIDERY